MKVGLAGLLLPVFLTGCTTQWPAHLPPETYSGMVRNAPLNAPEPNARIVATRPALHLTIFNFWPYIEGVSPQEIGEARSSRDGRFTLTTTGGYATDIEASSQDDWLTGGLQPEMKHGLQNVIIDLIPHLEDFTFSVVLTDEEVDRLESAFNKMAFHYVSTRFRETLSLDAYRRRGIISADEFAQLVKEKAYICGPTPRIQGKFPKATLRIDSFSKPIWFVPHASTKGLVDEPSSPP